MSSKTGGEAASRRAPMTRIRGDRPVSWTTILGLVLVPLTIAGVLLWGLWNPTERLEQVTAAVVNSDEPVELDGQTVPLGRTLAGELIDGDDENFTWVLTDEDDADSGLEDGRYTAVVTIPENFSESATSLSGDLASAKSAKIDVAESDRGRMLDSAISGIVTQTATEVLNRQLGEQFVGSVFVGMNQIGSGVEQAADGASQLAAGGSQLTDGAEQLSDGTQQLDEGAQQLSTGAGSLSSGASQLAGGTGELSAGAAELSTGTQQLSEKTGELAGGAQQLAAATRTLATGDGATPGLDGLAASVEQYTAGVNTAVDGVLSSGAELQSGLQQLAGAVQSGEIPMPEESKQALLAQLAQFGQGSGDSTAQLQQLKDAGAQLTAGAQTAAGGADQLATKTQELADGSSQLAAGTQQLAGGASQLSAGAAELNTGAGELSSGASQLAEGSSQLAANTPQLADGASQLADGVGKSAEGATDLSNGLASAAKDIPSTTESERDRVAQTALEPVKAEGATDELFNASGAPLFAGVALWAGALAAFLVLAPLWRRSREAARGVGYVTLRSAIPAVGLGALQGAIAGVVLPISLGYDVGQGFAFFGLALLAGISFSLLVQGLSALLGGFGRFVAFVVLVIAFAVGIVSTVPGPLAAIGDASPIGAAFSGFTAIATGASGAAGSATLLVLWGLGGALLTALAARRARARALGD